MALDAKALEAACAAYRETSNYPIVPVSHKESLEAAILSYLQHAGEGEPVAWRWKYPEDGSLPRDRDWKHMKFEPSWVRERGGIVEPLYAHPTLTTDTPVAEDGWRSIETVPKDGTEILLFVMTDEGAQMQHVAHWDGGEAEEWPWQVSDGSAYHRGLFTHWRPLPAAPQKGGE